MQNITESVSNHDNLDKMSTLELLQGINQEDQTVAHSIAKVMPAIEKAVDAAHTQLLRGGRIFYLGAGTSGRLGIVDASEIPPTFGAANDLFIGLIAGGDAAIRQAQENAEDDLLQGWYDMLPYEPNENDFVVGIAASGRTPYVIGALEKANELGIPTSCITCNLDSPLAAAAKYPIEVAVGPEFVTGSTRMKAGTAQKLVLNMLSTSVMIKLGHVEGNKMVDMQLSNKKLVDRGTKMIMAQTTLSYEEANALLLKEGSVRKAVNAFKKG